MIIAGADQTTTPTRLTIWALGKPITQGSKTRTRWGMRDDNNATLRPWRENVKWAATQAAKTAGWERTLAPVRVTVRFAFDRPGGHYGSGRNATRIKPGAPEHPATRSSGDLDKLLRSAFDALTDAGVWKDDAQVAIVAARKGWAGADGFGQLPGMRLTVEVLDQHREEGTTDG